MFSRAAVQGAAAWCTHVCRNYCCLASVVGVDLRVSVLSPRAAMMDAGGQSAGSVEVGSEVGAWILCGAAVWRHVDGGEESFAGADLAGPPVLFGSIRHGDHVASSEVQLAALLSREII